MTGLTSSGLYEAYRAKVLSYMTGRTESREDAEDLCEDVFEQVSRSFHRFDGTKASPSTWIYHIARSTLIDYLRTRHPAQELTEAYPSQEDLEDALLRKDARERLALALNELDRSARDIIVLHYYKGCSLTDVSRLTGISYGMVKVKHRKALSLLREKLE